MHGQQFDYQNHAQYITGHMIKSSRLSLRFSGEKPEYEANGSYLRLDRYLYKVVICALAFQLAHVFLQMFGTSQTPTATNEITA